MFILDLIVSKAISTKCTLKLVYDCSATRYFKTPISVKLVQVNSFIFSHKLAQMASNHTEQNGKESNLSEENNEELLLPPKTVNGMRELNKEAFQKTIIVPCLKVEATKLPHLISVLKKYLLKLAKFKPIQDNGSPEFRKILLNPCQIKNWPDFDEGTRKIFDQLKIDSSSLTKTSVNMGYDNWSAEVILKSILPKDGHPLTSFSNVGHIIHVNIKEHLMDYKLIIGQVLVDKVPSCRTVVNKTCAIDNTYRNFAMEILCGDDDMITQVKENNCVFALDYSTVFWNSRLSTEHTRIVALLNKHDVLFDVFCGIGPFSIPGAKKKCHVYANDLNPESYKWLNHNITLNKIKPEYITTYNKDGSDFILTDVKENLLKIWKNELYEQSKIHIVMNLPGSAITFVKNFNKLFSIDEVEDIIDKVKNQLPTVHLYYFVKDEEPMNVAYKVFEETTSVKLEPDDYQLHSVRSVSNNKDQIKISFKMPFNYLIDGDNLKHCLENDNDDEKTDEPVLKKQCL